MRCDVCTSTFARVPLLVSGAAQTCFDDQVRIYKTKALSCVAKDVLQSFSCYVLITE